MNKHIVLDALVAHMASLAAGKRKFFAERLDAPTFEDAIAGVGADIPVIDSEGSHEIRVSTPAGTLDPAFRVVQWLGPAHPTIVYHHGNNERPFDFGYAAKNTFYRIFVRGRRPVGANLIIVRAPFHNGSMRAYQERMLDLGNFVRMISTSVKINELLISEIRRENHQKIITCGISLGGWVTNLHRSFFNSSTLYAPLLAGTYLGELFLTSKYRRLTGRKALQQPDLLRHILNFNNEFEKVETKNVFPLLARYDQYIEYDVQAKSYDGHPIHTIASGHITGAVNADALRDHLAGVLVRA
jgi:hypothetical protein